MNRANLRGAVPGRASEVRCRHCQDRVLVITADRTDALEAVAVHLTKVHGQDAICVQGADFLIGLAPYRCDLCCGISEPPWWTYLTPPSPGYAVEDAGWLVCDTCHALVQGKDKPLRALVERSVQVQADTLILETLSASEVRAAVKRSIGGFLEHRRGEPVRSQE